MHNIAKFFIENSKLTIVLSLGLAFYGYQGLLKMNAEHHQTKREAKWFMEHPWYSSSNALDGMAGMPFDWMAGMPLMEWRYLCMTMMESNRELQSCME